MKNKILKTQKGNASVLIIFVLIVIFSIYLAGGPGLLLSGEAPKPEVPISGIPGAGGALVPTGVVTITPTGTATPSGSISPTP